MLGWGLARESIRSARAVTLFRVCRLGHAEIHSTTTEPHRISGHLDNSSLLMRESYSTTFGEFEKFSGLMALI